MKHNMIRLALVIVAVARFSFAGLSLTAENDYFTGSDSDYTNGMELAWYGSPEITTHGTAFVGYGVKHLIYTPSDITIRENQPLERPWSGSLTVFRDILKYDGVETSRTRIEVGVLGPSAHAKGIQAWFHDIIESPDPLGWKNQVKDEPVLNLFHERSRLLHSVHLGGWSSRIDAVYGGAVGTSHVDGFGGVSLRAGWNLPSNPILVGIDPKAGSDFPLYVGVVVDVSGMLVIHNATIGKSIFRNRDADIERDIKNTVGQYRGGVELGYNGFALSYMVCHRTAEFDGQKKDTDWGLISIRFSLEF